MNTLTIFEQIVIECYKERMKMPYSCHGGKEQRVEDAIQDAKLLLDGIYKFIKENQ